MKFRGEKKNPILTYTCTEYFYTTQAPARDPPHRAESTAVTALTAWPGHLQPQGGTRDPAHLAPLPNPYLAWDRAGRTSRKGKRTASTTCCMRVALLQPRWLQSSAASGLCAQTVTREAGTAGKIQGRRMSHHREGDWTEPVWGCRAREAQGVLHRHWEYLRTWG